MKPVTRKIPKLLNNVDIAAMPQDGIIHLGYTGKGWVIWKDGLILGFGEPEIDIFWTINLCSFLNSDKGSGFVDLGFGCPNPESDEFSAWHEATVTKTGVVASRYAWADEL